MPSWLQGRISGSIVWQASGPVQRSFRYRLTQGDCRIEADVETEVASQRTGARRIEIHY
jgi:hypothetical protein